MKVKVFCCVKSGDRKREQIIEMPVESTTEELDAAAEEFFNSTFEPEWWFEVVE